MSRFFIVAVVAVAGMCVADLAHAQRGKIHGHRGFARHHLAGGFGFYAPFYDANVYNSFHRPDNLPYFAKHPPVHYSDQIVRRPYGVSPYAAPAGVVPAEYYLQEASAPPKLIVNPYFENAPGFVPGQLVPAPDAEHSSVTPSPMDEESGSSDADQERESEDKEADSEWNLNPEDDDGVVDEQTINEA